MLKIRPAKNSDSKQVCKLIFDIWENEYNFNINKKDYPDIVRIEDHYNGLFLVAEIDEKIIGTLACSALTGSKFVLKRMFVKKDFRKNGVAQKLLDNLMDKVLNKYEYQEIHLFLSTKKDEAIAATKFYLKNEFKETSADRLPSNFPFFYEDDLFMMKVIQK